MSKAMKKLICALLSGAMLLTSVGVVGFASEEAPAATEAPAETAEATEAPAADTTVTAPGPVTGSDSSAYADDDYYRRALDLVTGLKIIEGFEDGSVQPDSNVTRAQMAKIVLAMLGQTAVGGYNNIYSDVDSGHWAAGVIQTATEQGIINGMGDGTFNPEGNVTYEQVCAMLVRALNYGAEAENSGGYPNGYINVASGALDLTQNAISEGNVPAERGLVIKMVYNALIGPYKELRGWENGYPAYNTDKTLGESRFDLEEGKGILKATHKVSLIGSADLLDGQILIDVASDDNDDDDGTIYSTTLADIDNMVGANIVYYYQNKASGSETVLTMYANGARSRTEEITNLDDIESMTGFDGNGDASIKMYGSSSAKKFETGEVPTIVYNGKTITNEDLANLDDDDARKWVYEYEDDGITIKTDETGAQVRHEASMNEFLKPKMGSIKLIDTDSNGRFETIVVEKYETMLVSSATASSLQGKINNVSVRLRELDSTDKTVTVTREGDTVRVRNLKSNDVASIKRDLNNEVIDIVVTAESFEGKISSRSSSAKLEGDDDLIITIDGDKHAVDKNAIADAVAGKDCIFYTDAFGRIGYIEAASANGMLASGEAYGLIMAAYESEDGESTMVKMMTQNGAVDYALADRVDIWEPGATDHGSISNPGDTVLTIHGVQSNGQVAHNKAKYLKTSSSYPIRLVKYKANADNKITKMYYAVDDTKVSNENALRIHTQDLTGYASMGASVGGYQVPDGILEITTPNNTDDMSSASNYAFGSVTSSVYIVRENGSTRHFVIGEFEDSVTPTILINFATSATAEAVWKDMDNAGGGPSAMLVESVDVGYDDDDNPMYTFNGWLGGSEATVKTNKNTIFGWAKTKLYADKYFDAEALWSTEKGVQGDNGATPDQAINEGDYMFYNGDGKVMIKLVDVLELAAYAAEYEETQDAETAVKQFTSNHIPLGHQNPNSNTRVHTYFGRLEEFDSEAAWLKIVDDYKHSDIPTIIFDPAKTIDIVEVDGTRATINPEGAGTAADLQNGDYVYVSTANKGEINYIVAYRIN